MHSANSHDAIDGPPDALRLAWPIAAMAAVVAASNILVQYPIRAFGLEDSLTYGALTYPIAFFISDLTNRRFGPARTRRVIYIGFAIAVALSFALATPRIALASGTAFLVGQLIDVFVFNGLRRKAWWRAPLAASLVGSAIDTILFFTLAFAGDPEMSAQVAAPLGGMAPLWVNLAFWDFAVKAGIALLALLPYGALLSVIRPFDATACASPAPISGANGLSPRS